MGRRRKRSKALPCRRKMMPSRGHPMQATRTITINLHTLRIRISAAERIQSSRKKADNLSDLEILLKTFDRMK
jgi:hypothetical protein